MSPEEPTEGGWLVNASLRKWNPIPSVELEKPRNVSPEHTDVMIGLLRYLRMGLKIQDLAWDHVDIPDRKADLPLKIHGKPYDIVFRWKGKLVCLEVDVYSPESIT